MNALLSLLTTLALLWALWYLYLIVMGLYRAKIMGTLTRSALVLGAPALIVGWLLDWLVNWLVASFIFRELPRTPLELVTQRLSRYIKGPPCLNKHYAQIICLHLLDPFDHTGAHCK